MGFARSEDDEIVGPLLGFGRRKGGEYMVGVVYLYSRVHRTKRFPEADDDERHFINYKDGIEC